MIPLDSKIRTLVIAGAGMLAGLAAGIVLGVKLASPPVPTKEVYDNNYDGKPDSESIFHEGIRARTYFDRNFDGAWDYWEWYSPDGHETIRAESDDNFDGKVDVWLTYKLGNIVKSMQDLDDNGVADVAHHCRYGIIVFSVGRPNGSTTNVWVSFNKGITPWKEYRDSDGDGLLERLTVYDVFGATVSEEKLNPPLVPTSVTGGE